MITSATRQAHTVITAQIVMAEVDTSSGSVPSPERPHGAAPGSPLPPPAGPPQDSRQGPPPAPGPLAPAVADAPRHRRWWVAAVAVVGLAASAAVGSAVMYGPWVAISPGDARPTEPLVHTTGVTTYGDHGSVLFTTVNVGRMTYLEWVLAHFQGNTEIESERQYFGTKTPKESREENIRVMGFSKDTAIYVALEHLGYDVKVTGGGVVVTDVLPTVPAASVLGRGDTITAVDGTPTPLDVDLRDQLAGKHPGDVVTLTIIRHAAASPSTSTGASGQPPASTTATTVAAGATATTAAGVGGSSTSTPGGARTEQVKVMLAKRDDGSAMIGIGTGVSDTVRFSYPFPIEIDTGQVGGPSAGLAFTLGTLDALTPGALTGGKRVAVTGTIDFDGTVGDIGGIRQKTVAVMRQKADVFLVPADQAADAQDEAKGSKLQVIGVHTLDEALQALSKQGGNALALGQPGKSKGG